MRLISLLLKIPGLFFLCLGIFLIFMSFYYDNYINRLKEKGVQVQAVVVGKNIIETKEIQSAEDARRRKTPKNVLVENKIEYEFITEKGEKLKGSYNAYHSDYIKTSIGDKRQVIYLPESPHKNMDYQTFLEEDGQSSGSLFMGVFFIIIGVMLTFFSNLLLKLLMSLGLARFYKPPVKDLTNDKTL